MAGVARLGPGRILPVAVLAAVMAVGCSSSARPSVSLGNDAIASIRAVTTISAKSTPGDAAPSPDGSVIYFTATTRAGGAVMRVPATGGDATAVLTGAPLIDPVGVAVATDGSRIFVADAGAGRIFSLPAAGGQAMAVAGSAGYAPRGLDVASVNGRDVIYFTGTDPSGAKAGLFSVPEAGGTPTVLAEGAPLVSPDGVVVTGAGVAYVTDRGQGANGGAVWRISRSQVRKIAAVRLGDPGGVSVTKDGTLLLVSSQNSETGADQVLTIDLASGRTGVVTKVVGANYHSSGGLHRAYETSRFAWADISRSGPIYRIDP